MELESKPGDALLEAIHHLNTLKIQEASINAQRIAQEERVINLLETRFGAIGNESSQTFKVADYKVGVTRKITYSLDADKLIEAQTYYPAAVKTKFEANPTYIKNLKNNNPDEYLSLANYINSKQAKPYVTVTTI